MFCTALSSWGMVGLWISFQFFKRWPVFRFRILARADMNGPRERMRGPYISRGCILLSKGAQLSPLDSAIRGFRFFCAWL